MELNTSKSVYSVFSRKNRSLDCIDGNGLLFSLPVVYVAHPRYLGVHFDPLLNWCFHLDSICVAAYRKTNIVKALCGVYWGANKASIMRLFEGFIRPTLEYACCVCSSVQLSKLHQLQLFKNSSMCIACGAFKSTPLSTLHAETGSLPLFNRRDFGIIVQYRCILCMSPYSLLMRSYDHWRLFVKDSNYMSKYCFFTIASKLHVEILHKNVPKPLHIPICDSKSAPWRGNHARVTHPCLTDLCHALSDCCTNSWRDTLRASSAGRYY